MKWFKHFSNAEISESLNDLIETHGFEGYGKYWRLLEILCARFDGECVSFKFHKRFLRDTLRFRTDKKMLSFMFAIGLVSGYKVSEKNSQIEIEAPILLDLKDRDFKVSRKNRGENAPKNKRKNKEKEIEKEQEELSYSEIETHPIKSKIQYLDVASIWNKYFPNKPAPFSLGRSQNNDFQTTSGYLTNPNSWDQLFQKARSLEWYSEKGWFNILWIIKHENALKIQQTENTTQDKASPKKINLGLIKTVLSKGFSKVSDIPESIGLSDFEKDFIINNGGLRSMGMMNDFELQRLSKEAS